MKKIIPYGRVLVVLIGPPGGGKSTLARERFPARDIVSTDAIREELFGSCERIDKDEFVMREFHHRIRTRLESEQRVVADATHLNRAHRLSTVEIGLDFDAEIIYMVMDRHIDTKLRSAGWRSKPQHTNLVERLHTTFESVEDLVLRGDGLGFNVIDARTDEFEVINPWPYTDLPRELAHAGFTNIRVIGDVHGNVDGLNKAIETSPEDTFFLFLGDVVDYGPGTLEAIEIVHHLMRYGRALNLRGNHEDKIYRYVTQERGDGFRGTIGRGNDVTVNMMKSLGDRGRFKWEQKFLDVFEMSRDWIQLGRDWLFVHAAGHPDMWENPVHRVPKNTEIATFALYGQTDGTKGPDGFPIRCTDWVDDIPQGKNVVVGHSVLSVDDPVVMTGEEGGRAIFLDTGSSKEFNGRPGKLSWMDISIHQQRDGIVRLIPEAGFGSE